jgi:hypothetical protein
MSLTTFARPLALACLLAMPLAACVSGASPVAGRAAVFATTVSRAIACRAGSPRRDTLERFLAAEKARGATDDQLASARSTYVTVSEAETINQGIRPQGCSSEERAELRDKMGRIRAGSFDGL